MMICRETVTASSRRRKDFCFGMDAVLLSGFAQVKEGEAAVDLGTGTGIIPILLEAKTKGKHFTGLEIQEEVAEMAERSVRLNQLESQGRHRKRRHQGSQPSVRQGFF